jgi:hypothetical protein
MQVPIIQGFKPTVQISLRIFLYDYFFYDFIGFQCRSALYVSICKHPATQIDEKHAESESRSGSALIQLHQSGRCGFRFFFQL